MAEQFPALNSAQRQGNARNKVPVGAGRSLMDWVRLTKSGVNLRGVSPGLKRVTVDELQSHNTYDDAWMAINGWVFNVTEYMKYHPGGAEELMRGVGTDATALFMQVHRWVNYESMLGACVIGKLVEGSSMQLGTSRKNIQVPKATASSLKTPNQPKRLNLLPPVPLMPAPKPASDEKSATPAISISAPAITISVPSITVAVPAEPNLPFSKYMETSWEQTSDKVLITINSKKTLRNENIVYDLKLEEKKLIVYIIVKDDITEITASLPQNVSDFTFSLIEGCKVVRFELIKSEANLEWSDLQIQSAEVNKNTFKFRQMTLSSVTQLTYDTNLYHFTLPNTSHMLVPLGHHVYIQTSVDEQLVCRPYTVVIPDMRAPGPKLNSQNLYFAIKSYPEGALSSQLLKLRSGDEISVSNHEGAFDLQCLDKYSQVTLICAGTGITPMVRLIHHCLHRSTSMRVKLVFFNKKERDIIFHEQFEYLVQRFRDRFAAEYVLSDADSSWTGKTGRVTLQLLKGIVQESEPHEPALTCVCGQRAFTNLTVKFLKDIGVENNNIFPFT